MGERYGANGAGLDGRRGSGTVFSFLVWWTSTVTIVSLGIGKSSNTRSIMYEMNEICL